jgi:hypothetical protein
MGLPRKLSAKGASISRWRWRRSSYLIFIAGAQMSLSFVIKGSTESSRNPAGMRPERKCWVAVESSEIAAQMS